VGIDYKNSGVDLEAAEASTKKISELADATKNKNVLSGIGLFSGFYAIDLNQYKKPVVVTSIDGVGTKLKIAFAMEKHDTVGRDLVNHCVNDIMTSGADPVAFTDYIGTVDLNPEVIKEIVKGMALACKENSCALVGGETAEMPGFYSTGEYDLVGSIIGLVDHDNIITGENIEKDDILIGCRSNGLHTNGYSLARKILQVNNIKFTDYVPELESSWGEILLKVHKSYLHSIQAVRNYSGLHGISHITGGGLEGNTKRLLKNLDITIDWQSWTVPAEFKLLQNYGQISNEEMRRTFNLGIGLVFVVAKNAVSDVVEKLKSSNENPIVIGKVI